MTLTRDQQRAEVSAFVERIRLGSHIAQKVLQNAPLRMPVGLQAKAIASGLNAWRDLLEGVHAGNPDAIAIAGEVLQLPRIDETAPAGPVPS